MLRAVLMIVATAFLAAACATGESTDSVPTETSRADMSSHDALRELRLGNERFVAGDSRSRNFPAQIAKTSGGHYPFATVLTSTDSRIAPEHVFDQGLGDLTVTRIGGMVVSDDVLGTLEYACRIGGTKVLVVLGHTDSTAIRIAIDPPDYELGHITPMITELQPAIEAVPEHIEPRTVDNPRFVATANEQHVWHTVNLIRERSPILRELIVNGDLWLIGAMYDVETGKVRWFE